MTASTPLIRGLRTVLSDMTQGLVAITHNGFALLGLAVMFGLIALMTQPELRQAGEAKLFGWLQTRQIASNGAEVELNAVDRATASNPQNLSKPQAAVAYWLSNKYRVAPEPLSALVTAAYDTGERIQLEPTLILAVMAVESGFNPFAQSSVGAQGLMQVMTRIHSEKYENFGGSLAAFDPLSNLRVGAQILKECIARAGSVEDGLKSYVGAALLDNDGGYTSKVMAEFTRLQQVAKGRTVAPSGPAIVPAVAPAQGARSAENVALWSGT
ncbi:MAG: hypothetical protein RIS90_2819 [Pseudomonadota bacterium]